MKPEQMPDPGVITNIICNGTKYEFGKPISIVKNDHLFLVASADGLDVGVMVEHAPTTIPGSRWSPRRLLRVLLSMFRDKDRSTFRGIRSLE